MSRPLSERAWEALNVAYDCRPASKDAFAAQGVRPQTIWLLERRGLLVRWNYANGPHWDVTNEGHEVIRQYFAALTPSPGAEASQP